jgi:hypothetical protein
VCPIFGPRLDSSPKIWSTHKKRATQSMKKMEEIESWVKTTSKIANKLLFIERINSNYHANKVLALNNPVTSPITNFTTVCTVLFINYNTNYKYNTN